MNRDEYYAAIEAYKANRVEHGGEWKRHKYIRIENGRYIYPEDLKGGQNSAAVRKADSANLRSHFNGVSKVAGSSDRIKTDRDGHLTPSSGRVAGKVGEAARSASHPGQMTPAAAKSASNAGNLAGQAVAAAKQQIPNPPTNERNPETERAMNADRGKTINDTINSFVNYATGKGDSMFSDHLDKFFEKYDDYLDDRGGEIEKQIMQAVGGTVEMKLKGTPKDSLDPDRVAEIMDVLSKYKKPVQHSFYSPEEYRAAIDAYKAQHGTQRVSL